MPWLLHSEIREVEHSRHSIVSSRSSVSEHCKEHMGLCYGGVAASYGESSEQDSSESSEEEISIAKHKTRKGHESGQ